MPRTSWPRAARPRHNASPMKPAAPVTTMRARPDPPTLTLRPDGASDLGANALKRRQSQRKAGPTRVVLLDPVPPLSSPSPSAAPDAGRRQKLLFLVTEDWYFCSHRLPVARAAREAGFEVVVATRVRAHGEEIRDEGLALRGRYPRSPGSIGASGPSSSTKSR